MNAADGTIIKKLVDGQTTNNFEELHLLTPGMSWSPDGKRIALSSKAGEQDAIFIIDVATGEQEQLTFGLAGVFSVDWSPKGRDCLCGEHDERIRYFRVQPEDEEARQSDE